MKFGVGSERSSGTVCVFVMNSFKQELNPDDCTVHAVECGPQETADDPGERALEQRLLEAPGTAGL